MLTDAQWAVLEPLVERCRPHAKVPPSNRRRTMGAILWRRERRQVALGAGRAGILVDGGADLPPLDPAGRVGGPARAGAGARRRTRHDLPRRHQRPGAPEGRRGRPKDSARPGRGASEALGRPRGGYGTKARVIADGAGRAVAFRLAPGQAHELPQAVPSLDSLPGAPRWVGADRGYTSHGFRTHVWGLGARPAIPPRRRQAPMACPSWIHDDRNRVERLRARLRSGALPRRATRRPPGPS